MENSLTKENLVTNMKYNKKTVIDQINILLPKPKNFTFLQTVIDLQF